MMMVLVLLAAMASGSAAGSGQSNHLVVVVEKVGGKLTYACDGRRLDPQRVVAGISRCLGSRSADTPTWVLLSEDVPFFEAYAMSSVLGNTMGVRPVRYFVFSRKNAVMGEITLGQERWQLSFDGTLKESNR
jgi:hypothetical protein